jgi:hypothetical protein
MALRCTWVMRGGKKPFCWLLKSKTAEASGFMVFIPTWARMFEVPASKRNRDKTKKTPNAFRHNVDKNEKLQNIAGQ